MTIFLPIIIDSGESERPDFQRNFKVELKNWEKVKNAITNVLPKYSIKPEYINDGFYEKRKYSVDGIIWLLFSFLLFVIEIAFAVYATQFRGSYSIWNHPYDFFDFYIQNWLYFIVVVPIVFGFICGCINAKLHPHIKLDWINVNFGKHFVYVEVEDSSKSWLERFMDNLKDELGDISIKEKN
jgi:hypothetical protein